MLDEADVSGLMRDILLGIPGIAADDVSFQNRPFVPPDPEPGVFWIEEIQSVLDETLNATEMVTANGLTLYNVRVAVGGSVELLREKTLAIANAFPPGLWMRTINNVPTDCPVHVWKTQRQTAFEDPASESWYVQPVAVNWRAHVPQTAQF